MENGEILETIRTELKKEDNLTTRELYDRVKGQVNVSFNIFSGMLKGLVLSKKISVKKMSGRLRLYSLPKRIRDRIEEIRE